MNPKQLGPINLAFIGDAVYELMVRERLLARSPTAPVHQLHHRTVSRVRASAQSLGYELIEPLLTEEEMSLLKRGRNSHSSTVPKNADPCAYRRATGVETLFGYLYLKGDLARIEELFAVIFEGLDAQEVEK
ncbi:Mini-ribonuclease 3 [Zongyangia hominis]|uniref:Mini-ribonuclease 3 n=1 Tax=Zongyangia hominis TaxID=2763677 RepID=A0A926I5Z5_9FIRM|nr:ribonuclease III domain-containing protein [Zongyangia hominis]MBC8569444.1 ribonuclease III [Zongyangia hominis]